MRNYLIAGFLLLIIAVAGCSSPSGSGTGSGEERLVQITPEEWDTISEARQYCGALSELDMSDDWNKCVTDKIGSDLAGKVDEWEKQAPLRSEIQSLKQQKEIEKNYNLSIGMTALNPSFKGEITLVSVDIPKDKSGVIAKFKIKNLYMTTLDVTLDDFKAVGGDGYYYDASPYPSGQPYVSVLSNEEAVVDVIFKLDPEKVRVEHIEYKEGGKVLATWI